MTEMRQCYSDDCGTEIPATPGNYYCGPCIDIQQAEHKAAVEAFDAFHKWADDIARSTR